MDLKNGEEWATIAGSITGFLSFIWIIFDKITNKPKIISSVRKATFQNEGGGSFGGNPRVCFRVSLEIGNIGSEPTTITQVKLKLSDGKILEAKSHQALGSSGFRMIVDDHDTRICEKGIAFVEHFTFYEDMASKDDEVLGTLLLVLIGGKERSQLVRFVKDN